MMSGAHLFITRFRGFLSSFVEHFAKANAFCDIKVELKCEETFHDAYLRSLASNDWQVWTLRVRIHYCKERGENLLRGTKDMCVYLLSFYL